MKKFRLKIARQAGEQKALEYGFTEFPIDPFKIAEAEGILIQRKDPGQQGVSGCIVFNDDGVGIILSTSIRNEGFLRFTLSHELGHYFIDGHPEEILKSGPIHLSRAGFSEGNNSIELEADHFASGLLLPSELVRKMIEDENLGLEGIIALCTAASTSLTATAIRVAECVRYPMAIIVSSGDKISYCFMSESFKDLGKLEFIRKGDPLPVSTTLTFNSDPRNVSEARTICGTSNLAIWFNGDSEIDLDEEVIGLGRYGLTLTVLTSEALTEAPTEAEDDDRKLIDSWTPKFAYGR